ncbi:MAG: hypothetical protein M3070_04785 [Actinomycetota bacterium]|nr:hypothetical protein [Actinomycetota bacterium]
MVQAWAAVGAVIAIASITAAMASAQPVARAAGSCSLVGKYRTLGPTYADSLSVSGTSCATGVNLIKAYNSCRLKAGGRKGHCHSKVLGFSCSEKRSSSGVQFIGTVRCTKGRAVVTFAYNENT